MAVAAAILAALVVGAAGSAPGQPDTRSLLEQLGVDIPARALSAPPFSLSDLGGASVRLAHYQDRIVMLYFWTTY